MSATNNDHFVVAVYNNHIEADMAVKELQKAGFDMKNLSIIGKDDHAKEHIVGFYQIGEKAGYWGKLGAFWTSTLGLLAGSAVLAIPGAGLVLVGGPLVGWIISALEGAVMAGGLSAVGIALDKKGIPEKHIFTYEEAIKKGKFVLISHGNKEVTTFARDVINRTNPELEEYHHS